MGPLQSAGRTLIACRSAARLQADASPAGAKQKLVRFRRVGPPATIHAGRRPCPLQIHQDSTAPGWRCEANTGGAAASRGNTGPASMRGRVQKRSSVGKRRAEPGSEGDRARSRVEVNLTSVGKVRRSLLPSRSTRVVNPSRPLPSYDAPVEIGNATPLALCHGRSLNICGWVRPFDQTTSSRDCR
jgi:hypothetical protein